MATDHRAAYRWAELARYNSEKARGIVHTSAMDEHMAAEQAAFDQEQADESAYRESLQRLNVPLLRKFLARKAKR